MKRYHVSKNLFDPKRAEYGFINDANGQLGYGGNSYSTDYIEVEPNTKYFITYISAGRWGAWYDENKTYISGITGYRVKTSPNNAKYMRVTVDYSDSNPNYATNFIIAKSDVEIPYEPFETDNLCITYKAGYRYNDSGEEIVADGANIYSVRVKNGENYTINSTYSTATGGGTLRVYTFNQGVLVNRIFYGNINEMPLTFTIPSGVDELRFSMSKYATEVTVNKGSTALPYTPYGSTWQTKSPPKYGTATEAVENPLYSDGTAITAYTIKGNTVQSGTPTPSAPISVNGVGNKTANLSPVTSFTNDVADSRNFIRPSLYTRRNGVRQQYLAFDDINTTGHKSYVVTIDKDNDILVFQHSGGSTDVPIITINGGVPQGKYYLSFDCSGYNFTQVGGVVLSNITFDNGYKIPILNNSQTIDIYIGDLPLLKSLDGTAVDEISNGTLTRRVDSDGSVLPTPTTTQITMPTIPTTEGANSITVDTTVQPSEFTATWTGWHNASVKEYDGSDWQ